MNLGNNISYLRRQKALTQEQLAEKMSVTRQTISRWESGEATPELATLTALCDLFGCRLDALVREDMSAHAAIYSEVEIRRLPAFTAARYVIISPEPESDVMNYMKAWGERNGISAAYPGVKLVGWDFPHVTQEQQARFGLHGYEAAYMLPEDFDGDFPGVEYTRFCAADYAVITVTEPFVQPFERIPMGYKHIMDHLGTNRTKNRPEGDFLGCFEHEYEKDGVTYLDIYVYAGAGCGQ